MLNLSDFDYLLPKERIAQNPAEPRDSCRLLILDRKTGETRHDIFRNIGRYLKPGDLLVVNDTRVMPARLHGKKGSGGSVELLLLHERELNLWECLVRPGRRLPTGTAVSLDGNGTTAHILERLESGSRLIKFSGVENIRQALPLLGEIPFPPYVTEATCSPESYQTVYARNEGSVAAPTAGLHFTPELIAALKNAGTRFAELTLHVGWGTFRPVQSESISEHKMEKEWFSISGEVIQEIRRAREQGGRVIPVGTTACRVLESLCAESCESLTGWTSLFIYPGFTFRQSDALITNFHLPKSTLLMLVSAFAGKSRVLSAYQEAVRLGYRFYSFGDAMFIV